MVHAEAEHESEEGPVSVESIESSFIIKGCSSLDFKAKADLSMPDLRAASSLSMSTATAYQVAIEQTLNKGHQGHYSSDFLRRQQKFDKISKLIGSSLISLIWTCRILNFEYLLLFISLSSSNTQFYES